jgi:hypothetical protein
MAIAFAKCGLASWITVMRFGAVAIAEKFQPLVMLLAGGALGGSWIALKRLR